MLTFGPCTCFELVSTAQHVSTLFGLINVSSNLALSQPYTCGMACRQDSGIKAQLGVASMLSAHRALWLHQVQTGQHQVA